MKKFPIVIVLALAACSSAPEAPQEHVYDHIIHGRFEWALREAVRLREEHPGDPKYEAMHRDATIAWLLDHGRRQTFADHDEDAIATFKQVLEIDPGSVEATTWIAKTRHKVSRVW